MSDAKQYFLSRTVMDMNADVRLNKGMHVALLLNRKQGAKVFHVSRESC